MIEVVCALIIQDQKVLIAQRNAKQSNPLLWEFPGGKLEVNETPEQALIREIKEELSIAIEIKSHLSSYTFQYPTIEIRMHAFVVTAKNPQDIHLNEHLQYQWIVPSDLSSIKLSAADYPALDAYLKNYSK